MDRATDTAKAICQHQIHDAGAKLVPIQTSALREQQLLTSPSPSVNGIVDGLDDEDGFESEEQMKARTRQFLGIHVLPLLKSRPLQLNPTSGANNINMHMHMNGRLKEHQFEQLGGQRQRQQQQQQQQQQQPVIAIVAHGVILQIIWICLAELFEPGDIYFGRNLSQADFEDGVAPVWSNTGVMELDIQPKSNLFAIAENGSGSVRIARGPDVLAYSSPSPLADWTMTILAVDSVVHLLVGSCQDQVGTTGKAVQSAYGLYEAAAY